jgi:hypothetical protein
MSTQDKPAVKPIHLNQMHNDAHFQLMTEFRDLVNAKTPEALKIDALWPAFLSRYADLDTALKKITKSAITDAIKAADAARDAAFVGITKYNKVIHDYHYTPAWRDAAAKIEIVLRTYGNVAAKPINEETSAIYNLVQELTTDTYSQIVTLIGLMPWVVKLGALNIAFESLMQERDRESEAKSHISMKTARRGIDDAYRNIVQTVNSLIFLGQLTGCEMFVDTYNIVVKRFNTLLKQQHSHNNHRNRGGNGGEGGAEA